MLVGRVSVPVLTMVLMTGAVKVLLVRVDMLLMVGTVTPPITIVPLTANPVALTEVIVELPINVLNALLERS